MNSWISIRRPWGGGWAACLDLQISMSAEPGIQGKRTFFLIFGRHYPNMDVFDLTRDLLRNGDFCTVFEMGHLDGGR
jgi:hypothetical protein